LIEEKAFPVVLSAFITPIPVLSYKLLKQSKGLLKALSLIVLIVSFPICLIWLLKIGWLIGGLTGFLSIFYSSIVRREYRVKCEVKLGLDRISKAYFI